MGTTLSFGTKVDAGLVWVVLLSLLVGNGLLLFSAWGGDRGAVIGAVIAALAIDLGTVAFAVPLRYRLDDERLTVRSGVVVWRIPLREITRVYPSRTLEASPAWSSDRHCLEYGGDEGTRRRICVSPEPRAEFLAELARRAGLRAEGERLVPERPLR